MQRQTALGRGRLWTGEEDWKLCNYVSANGEGSWKRVAAFIGTGRTAASCRQRWAEFHRPDLKKGVITDQDHEMLSILLLHSIWGNSWSKMASEIPGRTSNQIKNFWNTTGVKMEAEESLSTIIERLVERVEAGGENVESCLPAAAYAELIRLRSEQGRSHMQVSAERTYTGGVAVTSSWSVGASAYVSPPFDSSDDYEQIWSLDEPKNYTLDF